MFRVDSLVSSPDKLLKGGVTQLNGVGEHTTSSQQVEQGLQDMAMTHDTSMKARHEIHSDQ